MTYYAIGLLLAAVGAFWFFAWCLCLAASGPQHWFDGEVTYEETRSTRARRRRAGQTVSR